MLFVELWNVAEGRGDYASQSGTPTNFAYATADKAVDGNTNPDFDAGYCAYPFISGGISREDYAWWMVDLGSEYAIHSVIIYSADSIGRKCHSIT